MLTHASSTVHSDDEYHAAQEKEEVVSGGDCREGDGARTDRHASTDPGCSGSEKAEEGKAQADAREVAERKPD